MIKLVNPVADSNVIPLMILVLLLDAAAKSIPFRVLVLFVLVALLNVIFSPFTVVAVVVVLLLVTFKTCPEVAFVPDE